MKPYLWIFLLLTAIKLKGQETFSLQQAMDYAIKNGYSIQNAQTDVEIARKRVTELRGIGLPQLSADAGYQNFLQVPISVIEASAFDPTAPPNTFLRLPFGVQHNASVGYTASWLLFSGEYIVGLQAAKTYVDFSQQNLRKSEADIKETVSRAYYTALILQENKKILEENISTLDRSINETRAFFTEGFLEELDVDRLMLLKSNLSNTLNTLDQQIALSYKLLAYQMGYPVSKSLILSDELSKVIETIAADATIPATVNFSENYDNEILSRGITLQKLDVKRNRSAYLPTLSTFYSWKENRITNSFDEINNPMFRVPGGTIWGLSISMPIFKGFSQSARVAQSKLELKKLETQLTQLNEGLEMQFMQAKTDFSASLNKYIQAKEGAALAKRIKERTEIKFREGVGSSVELLQSENEFLAAQATYINSMMELLNARVTLDKNLNKY